MGLPNAEGARVGWILYDGDCGFCYRGISASRNLLRHHGFEIAPLQAEWVQSRVPLKKEDLLQDIRLLLADGAVITGADVYREVMKRIWWAWPCYLLSRVPGLRRVFDWAYRSFARNRLGLSAMCGLHPPDAPPRV
jgi:acetyl esterase